MNQAHKMQVEAKVFVASSLADIQKVINKYIAMGYQLQGAVTPVYVQGEVSYLATMVRMV